MKTPLTPQAQRRPLQGVFVTGTDTDVGKTTVSAILCKAWGADYWKPYQTGTASQPGDTETVAALLASTAHTLHPPACILRAPLAPWAAARIERQAMDMTTLQTPASQAPMVIEGAGGLYVPIDERHMMIDLAAWLALPVVLVTRSTLGTINHTLLSLQALSRRGIPLLGIVMNGPPSPGNRHALQHFGGVDVLAEIPSVTQLDAETIAALASRIPPLDALLSRAAPPHFA